MRDQGVKAPLMGGDSIAPGELAAIAGGELDRRHDDLQPDPRKIRDRPRWSPLPRQIDQAEAFTLYTYAVEVWAQAAEEAKVDRPPRSPR